MEKHTELRHCLSWEGEGKFEAEIVNGQISKLNFSEIGKGENDCGKFLNSTNYKFLQQVRDNLIQLFNFMEEENKKLGYSFPTDNLDDEPEINQELKRGL
jgi:hypothetical protein